MWIRIPAKVRGYISSKTILTGSWAHPASHSMGNAVPSQGKSCQGMKLSTHLHLRPVLRMSKTKILLSVQGFMVYKDNSTLPFTAMYFIADTKPFQQNSCPWLCSTNTRHKHDLQMPKSNLTLLPERSIIYGKKLYSTPPFNINTLNHDIKTYFSQHWYIPWLITLCRIIFVYMIQYSLRGQKWEIGSTSLTMQESGMIWCRRPKPM
jgi:hypothetical protein